MTDRSGVEIDYCPKCRGIWLDRGELDKLIDRAALQGSASQSAMPSSTNSPGPYRRTDDDDDDDDDFDDDNRSGPANQQQPHRRRRSWLADMFDFG